MKKSLDRRRGNQGGPSAWRGGLRTGRLALWVGAALVTVLTITNEVRAENPTNSGNEGVAKSDDNQEDTPSPNCGECEGGGEAAVCEAPGSDGRTTTPDPIDLLSGVVLESATDVSLPGLAPGTGYGQSRNYSSGFRNATGFQPRTLLGDRWMTGQADMFLDLDGNDVELYVDTTSKRVFTWNGSGYDAPGDLNATLVKSGSGASELYTLTNLDSGRVLVFSGLDSAVTKGTRGRLKEQTTRELVADSQTGVTFTYNTGGEITTVTTSQGWSATYTYVGGGSAVKDRIRKIEVKNGSATVLRDVEYTYYDDVSSPSGDIGSSGDLVQVLTRRRDSAGSDWIERYTQYRYFTNSSSDGKEHQVKCVIEADAVQRILDSGDTDVETTTMIMQEEDTTDVDGEDLSAYYSRAFTYYTSNESTTATDTAWQVGTEDLQAKYGGSAADEYATTYAGMAKSETLNGDCASCGGSGGGSGIRMVYYYMDLNGGPDGSADVDEVVRLVVEDTLTDSNEDGSIDDPQYRTVYGVNKNGALLRSAVTATPLTATANDWWCSSTVLGDATAGNSKNRVTERRLASAHTEVDSDTQIAKFLDPTTATNDADTVEDSSGVIYSYEYNSDGRRTASLVQEGETGGSTVAYYVSYTEYGDGTSGAPKHLPVEMRTYPNKVASTLDPSSNGIATTIEYVFWDPLTGGVGDTIIKTREVKLPTIGTGQNGSGVATASTQYYDELGRLRWTQDGEGYITYRSYHPDTGGLAYTVSDVNPTSLPTSADANSTKWITSSTDGASSNKPTRSGSLPTAIAMVNYSEFDDQGRTVKRVASTPSLDDTDDVTYMVYEATRTLTFPRWDSSTNKPVFPIRVTEVDDSGVMLKSYAVDPDRTDQTGGVPTGLSVGTDQSHYVSLATYHYDAITGQSTETRRYHDIPSSGAGTLSTNYDASMVQYDHLGRREYTIQTVSGTAPGSSGVEQVTQVVYESALMGRVIETKAGVSASGHNMGAGYDTYPTLRTLSKATYDDGNVGDGHLTQSLSYHGTGANDYTGANYHRDYRGRTRGVEPIYHNGSEEIAIGPYSVQDLRWDGRTTASAVYTANPTWATVLGDDDYAETITTNRGTLSATDYDDLGRPYRSKRYSVTLSSGAAGSYFRSDTFYDRNGRVVGVAPAFAAATEYAYDGLGRRYQTRLVGKLEGEPANGGGTDTADLTTNDYACYDGSGVFKYQSPTPNPDFSSMAGGEDYVYGFRHTEFTDNTTAGKDTGLPTRSYTVDMGPQNHTVGTVGVDFTNDDDYVVTYAYTYYDDADRPVAMINHGSGTNGTTTNGWEYGAEPAYAFGTAPAFTDTNVKNREALLTTLAYDATTSRRNLVTSAIGTSDPLDTVATKTFYDDFGRTTHVAENWDDFTPATPSTIGDGSDKSKDRVTEVQYDGIGNVLKQIAYNGSSASDQDTVYLYEDSVSASRVTNIIYPDSADTTSSGTDQTKLAYHVDGSLNTRTDPRGVVQTYQYNDRRQLAYMDVTSFGSSGDVDTAIQSIGYGYDALARAETITSYDDVSTGSPAKVNEVQYAFNGLGQLTESYQNHDGAVVTSGGSASPNISYGYDTSATSSIYNDASRLLNLDYAGGTTGNESVYNGRRRVLYNYAAGSSDLWNYSQRKSDPWIIREANTSTGGGADFLFYVQNSGLGRQTSQQFTKLDADNGVELRMQLWHTSDADGYDRFGRVAQVHWRNTGNFSDTAKLNYGYDAGSNRVYRQDTLAAAQTTAVHIDEAYGHDDLSRMTNWKLGNINTSTLAVSSLAHEQDWGLDALGNWSTFDDDDDGDGTDELAQTRTANDANEIGTIAATTGTNWVDPTYDAAGNMTLRPAPDDPGTSASAHVLIYDAWNRLVKITDNAGSPATIAEYEYDGLGRRIEKTVGGDTYDYYHSGGQVLEVRKNDDADPLEQFVYDPRYVDWVAIRYYDADTDGDLTDAGDGLQHYLRDASYSVIALLEEDGDVLERYRYTPYGERVVLDPDFSADADNVSDYGNFRGFQGLLHDEESGLIENRARMLDPLTGRFLQRDPLGYPDGFNAYAAYHVMWGALDPSGNKKFKHEFMMRLDHRSANVKYTITVTCNSDNEVLFTSARLEEFNERMSIDGMGLAVVVGVNMGVFGEIETSLLDQYPCPENDDGEIKKIEVKVEWRFKHTLTFGVELGIIGITGSVADFGERLLATSKVTIEAKCCCDEPVAVIIAKENVYDRVPWHR